MADGSAEVSEAAAGTLRARLLAIPAALRSAPLLAICVVTVLVVTGHFTAYTYITELIRRDGAVGLLLTLAARRAFPANGTARPGRPYREMTGWRIGCSPCAAGSP